MGYDISLTDPVTHEVLHLQEPHEMAGSMCVVGGTTEAWIGVTYNYSDWYFRAHVFHKTRENSKGIRTIHGMSGAESIPILKHAIHALEQIKTDITPADKAKCEREGVTGYWVPTRQNAIRPLYQLLALAQLRPDGVWEVS